LSKIRARNDMNISRRADCCVPHNKSFNASVDYYTKTRLELCETPGKNFSETKFCFVEKWNVSR